MKFYQSKLLNSFSNLTHCFTDKQNGNLAFHVNDDPDRVLKNHQNLAQKLDYKMETLVHMKQIHSNRIHIVTNNDTFDKPPTCDALITDKQEIPLMVMVADCSPILFYDPKQQVIAVTHAGRVGTFKNIVKNVIESFVDDFGSNPSNILACVGPTICQKCYEVGKEILQEAEEKNLNYAIKQKDDKYFLDIRCILKKHLRENGLNENHIELSPHCSQCDAKFYSYREDRACGRFAGLISLR